MAGLRQRLGQLEGQQRTLEERLIDALSRVMANIEVVVIPEVGHAGAWARPEFLESLLAFLERNRD